MNRHIIDSNRVGFAPEEAMPKTAGAAQRPPILEATSVLKGKQETTMALLETAIKRLSWVLSHEDLGGAAKETGRKSGCSQLHEELLESVELQDLINAQLQQLINDITV